MKVFILYPPISGLERHNSISSYRNVRNLLLPQGIFYLAASLRDQGHTVEVVDAEARDLEIDHILDMIGRFAPDVLGISATTVVFHRAVEIAEKVKQTFPNITLVLGGAHVTVTPRQSLETSPFEIGVIGEGEHTFLELLSALKDGSELEKVQGIVFKRGGEIIQTARRPLIEDLDTLPLPAYDLIPDLGAYVPSPVWHKDLPHATVVTSRGCPNQCTFCDDSIFGKKLRQRSPEHVAAEIILLVRKFGVREIAFQDDTFTLNIHRIPKLFSLLDAENIRFPWSCKSRINTVDEEMLRYMKSKGCWKIFFGIESGNPDILKTIKKNIQLDQVRKIITLCSKIGIRTTGYFMIGHPGETADTIEETIRFALSVPFGDISVTLNTPFPGSAQHSEYHLYGSLATTDWRQFSEQRPCFIPFGLTEKQLLEAQNSFYRRFYGRPGAFVRLCRSFLGARIRKLVHFR